MLFVGKLFIWLVSLVTVIVFFYFPVSAFAEATTIIAVQKDNRSSIETAFLDETIRYISVVFDDIPIRVLEIPYKEIQKLASERKINYAILSPDSYAALERLYGAHALVSQKNLRSPDKTSLEELSSFELPNMTSRSYQTWGLWLLPTQNLLLFS